MASRLSEQFSTENLDDRGRVGGIMMGMFTSLFSNTVYRALAPLSIALAVFASAVFISPSSVSAQSSGLCSVERSRVLTAISLNEKVASAGQEMTFQVAIKNDNPYSIPGVKVFIKIDEVASKTTVLRELVVEDAALMARTAMRFTYKWQAPTDLMSGKYEARAFLVSEGGFAVSGTEEGSISKTAVIQFPLVGKLTAPTGKTVSAYSKSITSSSDSGIKSLHLSSFPIKAGDAVVAFGCVDSVNPSATDVVRLSVLRPDGTLVANLGQYDASSANAVFNSKIDQSMTSARSAILKAEVVRDGAVISSASVSYECEELNCPNPIADAIRMVTFSPITYVALVIIGIAMLIMFRRSTRNSKNNA